MSEASKFITRQERYDYLMGEMADDSDVDRPNGPDRFFVMARELADGVVAWTYIETCKTRNDALKQQEEWVLHGYDPDPDYGFVDLDEGVVRSLNVKVSVSLHGRWELGS